jgi:GTP-binding protein
MPFYTISAVTGEGIDKLKYAIAESVAEHRTHEPLPPPEPAIYKAPKAKPAYPPPPPKASGSRTH